MAMNKYSQNILLSSKEFAGERNYWLEQLQGDPAPSSLVTDYPRVNLFNYSRGTVERSLPEPLTAKIGEICNQSEYGIYMVLLTGVFFLLSKYSNDDDLLVGMPAFKSTGKENPGSAKVLIVRQALKKNEESFRKLLLTVRKTITDLDQYKNFPFDKMVELLKLPVNETGQPLIHTVVLLDNVHDRADLAEIKTDLILAFGYQPKGLTIEAIYNQNLYRPETIGQFLAHFQSFFEGVFQNPDGELAKLELLSSEERQRILNEFNATGRSYPLEKTIPGLFEEQVAQTPDQTAFIFQERVFLYRELNQEANQLAHYLITGQKVKPETLIGILMERSPEMMIGILGILKAGAAYVPIDPEFSKERIKTIINDAGIRIMLASQNQLETLDRLQEECPSFDTYLCLDCDAVPAVEEAGPVTPGDHDSLKARYRLGTDQVKEQPDTNPQVELRADHPAYVIYTSGSTGIPKGVLIEHRAVHNFITGITERIRFTPGKSILALTTVSFDIFGLETLLPLTKGLKVVLAGENQQKNPRLLSELITLHQIEMLQITPTRMQLLINHDQQLECLKNLKEIMIGGEPFPPNLLEKLQAFTKAKIYNMYGPTETTIWSLVSDLTEENQINIGKPISNTRLYIVDENTQLQGIGIVGELCIAGHGLARGYLNRPDLSGLRFIPEPVLPERTPSPNRERLYKTGDLAKWLPDGQVDYLGRADTQIKIRGYRVELGEIEFHVLKFPGIKEAVALVKEDLSGERYLCAYFVADQEIVIPKLKEYLATVAPEYMIPVHYFQLESFPQTPNGKIDRKKLPEPFFHPGADGGLDHYQCMVNDTDIGPRISAILKNNIDLSRFQIDFTRDLISSGINSTAFIKLIIDMEKEFAVKFDDEDVNPDKFPNLQTIIDYVVAKLTITPGDESLDTAEK